MSKRFLTMSGFTVMVPLLAFALMRMRAESPRSPGQVAAESDPDALPEAIANLQRKIDSGKSKLGFDEPEGYLHSLLEKLDIPVSSQSLVFSKSSAQLFL